MMSHLGERRELALPRRAIHDVDRGREEAAAPLGLGSGSGLGLGLGFGLGLGLGLGLRLGLGLAHLGCVVCPMHLSWVAPALPGSTLGSSAPG